MFALAIGFSACLPAQASAEAGGSLRLKTTVEAVCEFEADLNVLQPGAFGSLGTVTEFCNTGDGYLLTAEHRPLASDETVRLHFDNAPFALNASGRTTIVNRRGPVRRSSQVNIHQIDLAQPVVLSVAISYL